MSDIEIVNRLIDNDEKTIEDFFFVRCRAALTYIGRYYFPDERSAEELIGDFYEYLSADDWHKLRIFKFTCKLNSYITIIASRYFQHKRDKDTLQLNENIGSARNISADSTSSEFFMEDLNKIIKLMSPLDRFLVERILLDGQKPGDILQEAVDFMRQEDIMVTGAKNDKQFAGYIYTRYNRAKKNIKKQMLMLGYGS